VSDGASANAASWPRRLALRGMTVEPIAAFGFAAVVSTLPAGSLTGHLRQGTAVLGNLFSEFLHARWQGPAQQRERG
jgi:hypothetical protein